MREGGGTGGRRGKGGENRWIDGRGCKVRGENNMKIENRRKGGRWRNGRNVRNMKE